MPKPYKVVNWKAYNNHLKNRGDIFIYLKDSCFEKKSKPGRGNSQMYCDELITVCHYIKSTFKLAYRQTQGLMESLNKHTSKPLASCPNYSTMCRRLKSLDLKVKDLSNGKEPKAVVIDSTGISIYNMSDWHRKMTAKNRKHQGYDRYRKLHIMMDLNSRQVIDLMLTKAEGVGTGDASCGAKMLMTANNCETLYADGAYFTSNVFIQAQNSGIKNIIIPPCSRRKFYDFDNCSNDSAANQYNGGLSYIKSFPNTKDGIKSWKDVMGYHVRSRIESFMASFKRTFGRCFSSILEDHRYQEMIIKVNALNILKEGFVLESIPI